MAGCGVVYQPVFRLHGAGVLGRVSGEREPFGEGLVSDAGPKARRTQLVFFFQRQGSVESVDPVVGVVFSDSLSVAKAVIESQMVNRRRGDSPFLARRRRQTVVPSFHCSRAAVLVALYGNVQTPPQQLRPQPLPP